MTLNPSAELLTLEVENSNVESIYTRWVLEASEDPGTELRPRSKELLSPSVKPTSLQFPHDQDVLARFDLRCSRFEFKVEITER